MAEQSQKCQPKPLVLVIENCAAPEPPGASTRLDQLILAELRKSVPSLSRAEVKKLFKEKRVKIGTRTAEADQVPTYFPQTVTILDWTPSAYEALSPLASPSGCFLPVLYEDEDLLILHKLSGVASVPLSAAETETAVNAAIARVPLTDVGRGGLEPGLLHRLDTGTSGILVFSKSNAAFDFLHQAWKEGKVRKWYRALCTTATDPAKLPSMGVIATPLGHDAKSSRKMLALRTPADERKIRGKPLPARTRLQEIHPLARGRIEVVVEIETGVMHQIRCHLASLGWPIEGDPVYRGTPSPRLWLHAWKMELPLRNGQTLHLEARLPEHWPVRGHK